MIKISDINHLNIMASLEGKQAKEIDIKQLMQSGDGKVGFEEKILNLCNGLRTKGFSNYAEQLETKFLIYKQAKVHLYRAHDEDGEDLVNEAHPDGDVHMADAENGYGDVHTTVNKHKKIVEIIEKVPTGKLASVVNNCKIALGDIEVVPPTSEVPVEKAVEYAKKAIDLVDSTVEELKKNVLAGSKGVIDIASTQLYHKLSTLQLNARNLKSSFGMVNLGSFGGLNHAKDIFASLIKEIKETDLLSVPIKNRYTAYIYNATNLLYAAMAALKNDNNSVSWHTNHVPSELIAKEISNLTKKLKTEIIDKKPEKIGAKLQNVYNKCDSVVNLLNDVVNELNTSNRNMHVSELKNLNSVKQSPLASQKIDSIAELNKILSSIYYEFAELVKKYLSS